MIVAYALVWPAGDYLLFKTLEVAESNRNWFKTNYRTNPNTGEPHGVPVVVELRGQVDQPDLLAGARAQE